MRIYGQDIFDAAKVNYKGYKVVLMQDCDFSDKTFTPIKEFRGEFDGNSKTIKLGNTLFTNLVGSTQEDTCYVHDLTLDFVESGKAILAGLTESADGFTTVENVTINGYILSNSDIGGIIGFALDTATETFNGGAVTVKKCTVNAKLEVVSTGNATIGGVVRQNSGCKNLVIEDCTINSKILTSIEGYSNIGAVLATGSGEEKTTITYCKLGADFYELGNGKLSDEFQFEGCYLDGEELKTTYETEPSFIRQLVGGAITSCTIDGVEYTTRVEEAD